jgi:hypothetical protein
MVAVLDHQIESFERSADEISPAGDSIRMLEELIDVGIALFDAVRSVVQRWQERTRKGGEPLQLADARELDALYRRLAAVWDRMAPLIDAAERGGEPVAGSARFRRARSDLRSLTSLSLDRVIQSEQQLNRGEARPLREVMDELRHRHHA